MAPPAGRKATIADATTPEVARGKAEHVEPDEPRVPTRLPPRRRAATKVAAAGAEKPHLAIVTGASSGIGAAIAARLARPGLTVALVGRNAEGLDSAAATVIRRGGRAVSSRIDLTTSAFEHWIDDVSERFSIRALYANAGLSAGARAPNMLETVDDAERLVRTNLLGTIMTVRTVVERMRQEPRPRERRHIAIVSSMAGLIPSPDLAVYGATKAALVSYGDALRPRLRRERIRVTVLCPGFVKSPMSERHHGAKPFEMSADRAARIIVSATEAGRRTVVFPFPYLLLLGLYRLSPGWLSDPFVSLFRARVDPDPRAEQAMLHRRLDRPRAYDADEV